MRVSPQAAATGSFCPMTTAGNCRARVRRHWCSSMGRGALTARMIAAALRRRVRSIVFAEGGYWRRRSVLAAGSRQAVEQGWSRVRERFSAGPGGLCQSLLDIGYRRSMLPALAAAPLAFGERPPGRFARRAVWDRTGLSDAGGRWCGATNREHRAGLRAAGLGPITVLVARLHNPPGNAFFLDHLLAAGIDVREVRAAETACNAGWTRVASPRPPKVFAPFPVAATS
jgi:hypothetical protein